jgi:Flp pilus assembly protein TadD
VNSVIQGFFSEVNKSNFETAKAQYLSIALINTFNTPGGTHKTIQQSFEKVVGQIKSVDVQGTEVSGEAATATAHLFMPWGEKWHSKIELIKQGGREWKISDWDDPERVGQGHLDEALRQMVLHHNWNGATNEYQAAFGENPKDAMILDAWGVACLMSGDLAVAENKFTEALQFCADFCSDEHLALAAIYEKQGKLSAAQSSLRRAMESKSVIGTTKEGEKGAKGGLYSMQALLYLDESKLDQAIEEAQKGVALTPDDPGALDILGRAFYKKGDRLQALNYLKRAAQKAPNSKDIQEHYAEASKGN